VDAALFSDEAVKCFDLVGSQRDAASQRVIAGFALVELAAFTDAEIVLGEAIASAERLGLAGVANEARLHLGQLFTRLRRRDPAVNAVRQAIEGFAAQNDRVGEGRARAYLSGALQVAGEHAAAAEEAERALTLLEASPPFRAALLGLLALTLTDNGKKEEAFKAGTEAMQLFEQMGGTMEGESIVRIGYAEGLRAKGDLEGSKRAIAAARERLLARANKMKNVEWRKGFLGVIQENVRTLARAGEWLA
jgi:tetratricopeptide (TPR) repeat protein